jgi:acyl-CoA dehydrogenase
MTDEIRALIASVDDACAKLIAPGTGRGLGSGGTDDGGWDDRLWHALEQIGATTLTVPEELDGSGGDLRTLVAVLEKLGRHSARVPLLETALLAGWLLAACGVPVPAGPLTAAIATGIDHPGAAVGLDGLNGRNRAVGEVRLERRGPDWRASGTLTRVGWARHATLLALLVDDTLLILDRGDYTVGPGTNLAGEPRDTVTLHGVVIPAARVRQLDPDAGVSVAVFEQRAALGRTALIAGAARRALELTVAYAGEREQFGRPIGKFQAVQQHVAALAGEALLCTVAAHAAAAALDAGLDPGVPVAAAKAAAGESAGRVCRLAHQVHGAIGFTDEHPLHKSTVRLWAWRDEAGTDAEWAARLGEQAIEAGAEGLWPLVTGSR